MNLSWSMMKLLRAMKPGESYSRLNDPCRTTAQTINSLIRSGYLELVPDTEDWLYRLTKHGESMRAVLKRQEES